jgi:ornithine--oxo-acid transaminase
MSPLQAADSAQFSFDQSLRPDQYRAHVNPQWVRLLDLLGMNVQYTSAEGAWLHTADGRAILDFLSGYCVHNTGHNHPRIVAALQDELSQNGAAMAQSHASDRAGELAARLCERAGSPLKKVFFCSSGSEGVETVIKFSRAFTGRNGMLYADGAFHGLTCGALSLMGDPFWRGDFGSLLPDTQAIPFGDIAALEMILATRKFAALILEPIQSEAGIRIPDAAYLQSAQQLCRKYGTLFVLDEVQTGLGRTGKFLAGHRYNVQPDMVVLAKALSGGLIPSAAVLMTDEIYRSVYDSLKHSIIHTSTYSENGLAMRAGLATLDVIQEEGLIERSERLGTFLRRRLYEKLSSFEMVKDVRGVGLLSGIEFTAPKQLPLCLAFETFRKIHPGMFGQTIVMRLFREKNILTQMCGNNFMVLKVAPPLIVSEDEIDRFVTSITEVVELVHSSTTFWSDALGLAKRAINL